MAIDSFGMELNANDVFMYACAMSVYLDSCDFWWAVPVVKEYGPDGEIAVMGKILGMDPIKPRITEKYKAAKKMIEDMDIKEMYSLDILTDNPREQINWVYKNMAELEDRKKLIQSRCAHTTVEEKEYMWRPGATRMVQMCTECDKIIE